MHFPLLAALAAGMMSLAISAQAETIAPVDESTNCESLLENDYSRRDKVRFRLDAAAEEEVKGRRFCVVAGYAAPALRFEVRLPMEGWTQRYLQIGCGGYCGGVSATGETILRQSSGCAPLEAGEMVLAASNMGHDRSETWFADGLWAVENPGAMVEFAYTGLYKTSTVAHMLIEDLYGQPARYSYFSGCSNGGREALVVAQRYPDLFDGLVAGAPTIDYDATNTVWHAWNTQANTGPDGMPILTVDKLPALAAAVTEACAAPDGLIDDPRACGFEASTLLCEGKDGPDCLTAEQVEVVDKVWQGPVSDTGEALFAGGFPKGSELAWIGSLVPTEPDTAMAPGVVGESTWSWDFPMFMSELGAVTGIVNTEIAFTADSFDRLTQLQGLLSPTDTDLSAFAEAGGRLVIWQGWADSGTTPFGTLNYVARVQEEMGPEATSETLALYMVPGAYHCSAGPRPVRADYLSEVMAWVEDGEAPGPVTVTYEATETEPAEMVRDVAPYGATGPEDVTEWRGLAAYTPGPKTSCTWQGTSLVCE